jgi:hypothetical protein
MMKRVTIAMCAGWFSLAGICAAQAPVGTAVGLDVKPSAVKTVAAPSRANSEILPPVYPPTPIPSAAQTLPTTSPGEAQSTREARAHEQHLLQSQAQAEAIHRAAVARFEQRTRRLESQRWYGISNMRPSASTDPYNGDYSPGWVSNYLFYPYRWVSTGEPWTYVEVP